MKGKLRATIRKLTGNKKTRRNLYKGGKNKDDPDQDLDSMVEVAVRNLKLLSSHLY